MVSVVIPVYNAQATVARCLDSVLAQTYDDWEILAVNDGSADDSLDILRRYAQRDARVRVMDQPNGGVAAARNRGLGEATGDWVQFVDSDDTLLPDAMERMVRAMETNQSDLAIAPYVEIMGGKRHTRALMRWEGTLDQRSLLHHFSLNPNSFFYAALWNKLYRRHLIEKHGLRFDGDLPWGEDFDFNTRYYRHVRGVSVLREPVYEYARSAGGLAMASVRLSVARPAYSVRLKIRLYRSYVDLYREAGLYDAYRHVLPQYLFRVTLNK